MGRHAWAASAIWRPDGGQTDWSLSYAFSGLGTQPSWIGPWLDCASTVAGLIIAAQRSATSAGLA